jgi:hypothetical protein
MTVSIVILDVLLRSELIVTSCITWILQFLQCYLEIFVRSCSDFEMILDEGFLLGPLFLGIGLLKEMTVELAPLLLFLFKLQR